MKSVYSFVISCILSCTITSIAFAQAIVPDPTVTIAATKERIRITAPNTVVQLRLEIYDQWARKIFDTEQRGGSVLDWHLQSSGGARVLDGAYVGVVTVKDLSGRFTQRIAAIEVAEQKSAVRSANLDQLNSQQLQAIGPISEGAGFSVVENNEVTAATLISHDGEQAQITRTRGAFSFRFGDFFRGRDVEQMRLTEAGDLGLGTAQPKARLDVMGDVRVSGLIRAKGIQFPDGSIQITGSSKPRDKDADFLTTNATGTGTQNRLAKWIDDVGTLGDSAVTEANGRVGIANGNPSSLLHIGPFAGYGTTNGLLVGNNLVGTQFDRSVQISPVQVGSPAFNSVLMYALPTVNSGVTVPLQYGMFIDGKQGLGVVTSYAAMATGQVPSLGATNNTHLLLGQLNIPTGNFGVFDATGFNNFFSGNVGIGVSNPTHKLDVAGNVNTTTQYNILGQRALSFTGLNNTFLGLSAGTPAGGGANNSFFGRSAGQNTTGNNNSFFGSSAGGLNSSGLSNSFFGRNAGLSNTSGSNNSFFGLGAGDSNTNGSNLTVIGASADVLDNLTNATAIGHLARVEQSNSMVLGSISGINAATADTNVGIGTPTPASKLEVRNGEISSTGPTGGRIAVNNPNNQGARFLLDWFNDGTKHWPRIRFGGNGEGSANGFLIQGPSDATKLAVLQNGNVGIGSTAPVSRLTVSGAGNFGDSGAARFDLFNTVENRSYFQHVEDDGTWQLGRSDSSSRLSFNGGSNASLSILSEGNMGSLGLGSSHGTFRQTVSDSWRLFNQAGAAQLIVGNTVTVASVLQIQNSTSQAAPFVLCHTGFGGLSGSAVGNCSSSIRFKENLNAFRSGMNLIKRLRPVTFDWKDTGMHDFGLIAEEVAEVEPLLVTHNKDGEVQGVKYERLGVVLINAIREQQAQIEELRRVVSTLEQQNKSLSGQLLLLGQRAP